MINLIGIVFIFFLLFIGFIVLGFSCILYFTAGSVKKRSYYNVAKERAKQMISENVELIGYTTKDNVAILRFADKDMETDNYVVITFKKIEDEWVDDKMELGTFTPYEEKSSFEKVSKIFQALFLEKPIVLVITGIFLVSLVYILWEGSLVYYFGISLLGLIALCLGLVTIYKGIEKSKIKKTEVYKTASEYVKKDDHLKKILGNIAGIRPKSLVESGDQAKLQMFLVGKNKNLKVNLLLFRDSVLGWKIDEIKY